MRVQTLTPSQVGIVWLDLGEYLHLQPSDSASFFQQLEHGIHGICILNDRSGQVHIYWMKRPGKTAIAKLRTANRFLLARGPTITMSREHMRAKLLNLFDADDKGVSNGISRQWLVTHAPSAEQGFFQCLQRVHSSESNQHHLQ